MCFIISGVEHRRVGGGGGGENKWGVDDGASAAAAAAAEVAAAASHSEDRAGFGQGVCTSSPPSTAPPSPRASLLSHSAALGWGRLESWGCGGGGGGRDRNSCHTISTREELACTDSFDCGRGRRSEM
ncbi:hypothetical protein E2C01_002915 [Portunus trituberculatus]|uniref:Uncharacterized protein n=1 Tax=Portunus trituberculatus TaxID=210409 RepID=A0A5B7CRZ5_PORTR|nr:hypothetical protein [Portunus trituberculatus]